MRFTPPIRIFTLNQGTLRSSFFKLSDFANRHFILVFILFFLTTAFYGALRYVHKKFPGVTVEELVFFLCTSWQGADERLIRKFFQQVVFNPCVILVMAVFFRFMLKTYRKVYMFILFSFSVVSLCSYLIYVLVSQNFFYRSTSQFYEQHYIFPEKVNISFGKETKNLILIVVESLENTYSNKDFFGKSLIPDLEKINGIRFLCYQDGYATNFTQGSWIATFMGIPANYYASSYINAFGKAKFETKLKNIRSLGKILKQNGYNTIYMKGAAGNFSGTKTFIRNQGIENFIDKASIADAYPQFQTGEWGYEDQDLMRVLKDNIKRIDAQKPFAVFVETVDMHGANKVAGKLPNKFNNIYLNTIYHTNLVVADFVKWFEKRPEYKDTLIVIAGDHLRMGSDFQMPQSRQIYNLFINAPKPKRTDRMFSQIDMFPTLLEAMGAQVEGHALGLGVSVFSEKPTLLEQMGAVALKRELSKKNKLYEHLWED